MFDRSFLPDAQLEFVIVSDTHYMLDTTGRNVEFESRRQQSARAERALRLAASLNAAFVIHLGDLVQEYPETERFQQAMAEARAQLERCGLKPYLVAGNHDVGDKPDPTMPTNWVTPEALSSFHTLFGRSWYSWDKSKVHFIVLNSQILNTDLPEVEMQQHWLETDLAAHAGQRIFMFLHLGLFLNDEHELSLGHYDNIAEPARSWLLNLIRQYGIEMVFSAHSHFAFFNRIGATRYFNVVSTSFTRPGFSQLFSSGPPPEQGRDDVKKVGFYLVRIQEEESSVHFIRTYGDISPVEEHGVAQYLVSRISRDLRHSPLGIILHHPLAHTTDLPIAYPSIVRQPVRNDYLFLSCIELGVRQITVPASDLNNPLQQERLAYLRDEGLQVKTTWLWYKHADLLEVILPHLKQLDGLELQLLGTRLPDETCLKEFQRCRANLDIPITLSAVIPNERVAGKQHLRTRSGYHLSELVELNQHLVKHGAEIDRVLCRVDAHESPWDVMREGVEQTHLSQIGAIDWAVEFGVTDEQAQVIRAAEALYAAALFPDSHLFLEPLVDLDRTMDVTYGLLDRMCNPRAVFNVVRYLNTILFSTPETRHPVEAPAIEGARLLGLEGPQSILWLLLPTSTKMISFDLQPLPDIDRAVEIQSFDLVQGLSQPLVFDQTSLEPARYEMAQATLFRIIKA